MSTTQTSPDLHHAAAEAARFNMLMAAGKSAYRSGQPRLAHDLWREAATINPYTEQVWAALLRVLETDDDRIVCLQNIIAINPLNVQARSQLNRLMQKLKQADLIAVRREALRLRQRARARRARRMMAVRIVGLGLLGGALGGVVASIVVYGGLVALAP